jgi:uncharacterized protein DUF4345
MRWRGLQLLLALTGTVAIVTGVFGVVTGGDGIPGEGSSDASVESELRFLYVFWIGYGLAMLYVVSQVETATLAVRALAAILFAAGLARAFAWIDAGRPDALFAVLMVAELVLPPLMVVWQARLASSSPRMRST